MPNYFDQFDVPAQTNYFDQFDAKAAPQKTPASTLGYIGSRLLGGFLEGGKQMGNAAAIEMGQPQQQADMQALPSGQQQVNQAVYGQPSVQPPNAIARYGGAVASAAGENPVMAAVAPGYTAFGALGGEGASDLNKVFNQPLSDPIARLIGGLAGGGAYGIGKGLASSAINPTSETEAALQKVAQTKAAIESGQGMFGEFQQKAKSAANSLSNIQAPNIDAAAPIQMTKTLDALTTPNMPVPESVSQLTETLNRTGGTLPYGTVRAWLNQVGPGPVYQAMNADLKSSIGSPAASQLEQANLANSARYFLNKSVTPSGFYDPMQLTKALAKTPQGDAIGSLTPEMDAMTDHAGQITDLMSQWYRGSIPQPSALGQVARQLTKGAAAMGVGHVTGSPETGALLAGYLLGHGDPTGRLANVLYGLPQSPMLAGAAARVAPWAIPSVSGGLLSGQ